MPNDKKKTDFDAVAAQTTAVAVPLPKLKPARLLTMDATSIARLGEVICQTTGELEQIQMPGPAVNGEVPMAWAVPILDVVHQTQYLLICNAIIVGALRRSGEPLRGKYYAMRAGEIKQGKRFRSVEVIELELVK